MSCQQAHNAVSLEEKEAESRQVLMNAPTIESNIPPQTLIRQLIVRHFLVLFHPQVSVIASANNRYFYYPNEQDQNEKMINVRLLNLNFNAFPPLPTTASSPALSSSASFVLSNDGGAAHAALLSGLSSSSSLNSTGDSAVVDRFLQHANMMFDVSW